MNIIKYINRINDLYGNEPVPRRFDTTQWLRPGFRGAGLVDHGPEGVRQGYASQEGAEKTAKIRIKKGLDTYRPIDPATSKPFTLKKWTDIGSKKRYRITSKIKGVEVDTPHAELTEAQKERKKLMKKKRYHMHPEVREKAIKQAKDYYWEKGGAEGQYKRTKKDVFGKGILREEKNRLLKLSKPNSEFYVCFSFFVPEAQSRKLF